MRSIVREFGWPDYEAVLRLWAETGLKLGPSESREGIALKLDRDPDLFLLAQAEGDVAGAVLGAFDGRRGWIYHLAVRPDRQRQGIGHELLTEVERRLRAKGCLKINLLIEPGSAGAAVFYERLGYREIGRASCRERV